MLRLGAAVVVLGLVALNGKSPAAEFRIVSPPISLTLEEIADGRCILRLYGDIERGDSEKLEQFLDEIGHDWYDDFTICLDSLGGDYIEGIKLAKTISERYLVTIVDKESHCFSACAIAFLGGIYESGQILFTFRLIHRDALLGFHMPYLKANREEYSPAEIELAYMQAIIGVSELVESSGIGDNSLAPVGRRINMNLLREILSTPPEELSLVDTVDDIRKFDISLIGGSSFAVNTSDFDRLCINALKWRGQDNRGSTADSFQAYLSNWPDGPVFSLGRADSVSINGKMKDIAILYLIDQDFIDYQIECIVAYDNIGTDQFYGEVFILNKLSGETVSLGSFDNIDALPGNTKLNSIP